METTPLEFPSQIDLVNFVSHYAHDLRSPFNRMMGFLKIVLKGQDGPLTDLQKEDLETVYQNSVYAFTMVSNLIDISRLIAGEKSLSLVDIGVPSLFQQAITGWEKYHSDVKLPVQVETHLIGDIASIQVDGILLSQAITGLIACVVECVKHPVRVDLTAEEEPGGLAITVRSTGQPADNPSKIDLDSYGYISRTLISLHRGEFRLQEIGNEGAAIQFMLPRG